MLPCPYAVSMASIAATATGLRTSETIPRMFTFPCCCRTFAIPIAVASSHQRERSVSMITLGPLTRGTVMLGAETPDAGAREIGGPFDFEDPDEHPAIPTTATKA